MDIEEIPEVRRVSFDEHARAVAADIQPDDPDRAGAIAREATRLDPLQRIQVAFDQIVSLAADHRRGKPWDHAGSDFASHVRDVMDHARGHSDILHCAAEAADTMIGRMADQLNALETAMNPDDPNDPNRPGLTSADGSPHPLIAGGYDADADPQLPGNVSDVAALKEGKTTRQQAAAIQAGDAAKAEHAEEDRKLMEERATARAEKVKMKAQAPASPAPFTPTPAKVVSAPQSAPIPAKPATPTPPPKPPEASGK